MYGLDWSYARARWQFQSARKALFPSDIQGRCFFIAVSLRSPLFTNDWLSATLNGIRYLSGEAVVTLVDEPYNVSTRAQATDNEQLISSLERLRCQREQQLSRLRKTVLARNKYCTLLSWSDLASHTPAKLRSEIWEAFLARKKCYLAILNQTRSSVGELSIAELESLASFFLDEAPTLLNVYYNILNGCVDVYPGAQAPFFWHLDGGLFSDELPLASELARAACPLTYSVTTMERLS